MKSEFAIPVGLCSTFRAAAIAVALCSPVYAAGQESADDKVAASTGDTSHATSDRTRSDADKPADNTAHNERDRSGDTLTPFDQSNAESDVEITRSIRQKLVDDDSLGTNAQNVKVVTVKGMVTLRGAVASAEEQARIVAIAKEAAGQDRVSNETQVIKD